MKLFTYVMFTLIFTNTALAGTPPKSIQCSTSPLSTSYLLDAKDDQTFELAIFHHNGVAHAPLINGVVTGHTIDLLKERFDYVTKMGTAIKVNFKKSACRFSDNGDLGCFHKEPATIGELKVDDYYFSVHKETNISRYGEFPSHLVSFEYRVKKRTHKMQLNYYSEGCRFR